MKKLLYVLVPLFLFSCVKVDDKKDTPSLVKNSDSEFLTMEGVSFLSSNLTHENRKSGTRT